MSQAPESNGKTLFVHPATDPRGAFSDTPWGSRLLFDLTHLGRPGTTEQTDFSVLPDEREYSSIKSMRVAPTNVRSQAAVQRTSAIRPQSAVRAAPFVAVGNRPRSNSGQVKSGSSRRRKVVVVTEAPLVSNRLIFFLALMVLALAAAESLISRRSEGHGHKREARALLHHRAPVHGSSGAQGRSAAFD